MSSARSRDVKSRFIANLNLVCTNTLFISIDNNDMNKGGPILTTELWDAILERLPFSARCTVKSVCLAWCRGAAGDHNAAYVKRRLAEKRRKSILMLERRKAGCVPYKIHREVAGLGTLDVFRSLHFWTATIATLDGSRTFTYSSPIGDYVLGAERIGFTGTNIASIRADSDIIVLRIRFHAGHEVKLWTSFSIRRYDLGERDGDGTDDSIAVSYMREGAPYKKEIDEDLQPIHDLCEALSRSRKVVIKI